MKSSRLEIRRRAALIAAVVIGGGMLSGCSSDGGGDWLAMLKVARNSWEQRDAAVGLNEASAIPYSTLGVRIDGGREQIMVLAVDAGGERLWASSAHVAISTRDGRVVGTAGFGTDMSGYLGLDTGPEDWSKPHIRRWTADFPDIGRYSVLTTCDVSPKGSDPITILGKTLNTIRVDERCRNDSLDWSFEDSYWVSVESQRVWRAITHFHPKGPALEIELLRPPLSAG